MLRLIKITFQKDKAGSWTCRTHSGSFLGCNPHTRQNPTRSRTDQSKWAAWMDPPNPPKNMIFRCQTRLCSLKYLNTNEKHTENSQPKCASAERPSESNHTCPTPHWWQVSPFVFCAYRPKGHGSHRVTPREIWWKPTGHPMQVVAPTTCTKKPMNDM